MKSKLQQQINIKTKLNQAERAGLERKLDKAFHNPRDYAPLDDAILPDLPPVDFPIKYVEQYSYATGSNKIFRTGLVTNCTVVTIFNEKTILGALFHLARENMDFFCAGLKQGSVDIVQKKVDIIQDIIKVISQEGEALPDIKVSIIGGNKQSISLWHEYIEFLGVKNIKIFCFPKWIEPHEPFASIEEMILQDNRGFIQFSSVDGSIHITENGGEFEGHLKYTGGFLVDRGSFPVLSQAEYTKIFIPFPESVQSAITKISAILPIFQPLPVFTLCNQENDESKGGELLEGVRDVIEELVPCIGISTAAAADAI